ncbi:CarD family transcriptional regulator [Muricoccus aerilatus]|uniref:CarD family transcriptional regulator n=1 Tax=Muricoccus aerilatus TaxID=452982 RepID=UPI0009FF9DCA|nr:CarD family transcriptional regulator [Roseomonas aerilata]
MNYGRTDHSKNVHAARSDPNETFVVGDRVVFPAHRVERVEKVAKEEIAGHSIEIIQISFDDSSMTVRVPVAKIGSTGLRRVASPAVAADALTVLEGKPRTSKMMWARRAQDYDQRINSGDPMLLAEVVRDLRRNANLATEGSFSERQLFERAIDRLAAEVAAVEGIEKEQALGRMNARLRALDTEASTSS